MIAAPCSALPLSGENPINLAPRLENTRTQIIKFNSIENNAGSAFQLFCVNVIPRWNGYYGENHTDTDTEPFVGELFNDLEYFSRRIKKCYMKVNSKITGKMLRKLLTYVKFIIQLN